MNFEFLRESRADLAVLGGFAEHYAFNDPSGALIKLRQFTERVVDLVYEVYRLPRPHQANLIDLLNETCIRDQIPDVILAKLHTLRIQGNKAAHSSQGSTQMALAMVREAFDISCWVWLAFCNGKRDELLTYSDPKPPVDAKKLEADRTRLFKQIAEQEALVQSLLEELELTKGAKMHAERTAEELQQLTSHSQTVADELKFNETTTRRRLIDTQLLAAGWKVEDNTSSNDEVGQEVEVTQEFLDGGKGWADYVLWGEDGKPLAVVEAKKTAKDAQIGRQQAKLYADGLERDYGQRPVVFYTNGFDLFIWDDAQKQTPRRLFGFYSKKSLQYLIYQRAGKLVLANIPPKLEIADRMYQLETVKRVCDRFSTGHRKALIVLTTGTGKTRVAASLCDVLQRGQWAKRILFLCDRRELRKQANDVFKEHLSGSPRIILDGKTAGEDTARIYLATYPAMLRQFEHFDTGFFDLIIADESHRSIYNRYRDIFLYFDALQVGLTATPVLFIARNTFSLFNCENGDPTAAYTYEDAIAHTPPYLVPFEVVTHTTEFLRRGIKYQELSAEQRQQLEEDQPDAEDIDFEAPEVDKVVFNKDTNRIILRNLMENGIREATGAHPGKTIIFARNHRHAILLSELFDEMYPQYGGEFCRVIDNYDPRAEQLIDNFKDPKHPLTIAVSVDMLDTGIDVPEVVNLVFAKPVKSFVKFWQMIGRGTRLCQNLFGPGKDKTSFSIFDHWGNFEFFEQTYVEAEPAVSKSLLQRLFEMRIDLADIAYNKQHVDAFDLAIKLLKQDLSELPENTIAVREKWKAVRECQREGLLQNFAPATRAVLVNDMALLMQWRDTRGQEDAYSFDLLSAQIQSAFIQESSYFDDLKMQLLQVISELPINVNAVRDKIDTINAVKGGEFWSELSVASLEHVRTELRGIMRYRVRPIIGGFEPRLIDVKEDASKIETNRHVPKLAGLELAAYRQRVEEALKQLFDTNHVIRKIRRAEPVSKADLDSLVSLLLTDHPDINLSVLTEFYPDSAGDLAAALRSIVGLEAEVVATAFSGFVATHPMLNAKQQRFLALLQNHIAKYGAISIEKLYEAPFIQVDADGLDGVFESQDAEALIGLIQRFRPQSPATA